MIPREFLGAFKAGHRKTAREFIDEDLAEQLLGKVLSDGCEESRELLAYITKFNNEFYKDYFDKTQDPVHNTTELKRDCQNRNNQRRRDVYSQTLILHAIEFKRKTG